MQQPMLCSKIDKTDLPHFLKFAKGNWIAEEKHDGDRILMHIDSGNIKLIGRTGRDKTQQFPEVLNVINDINVILDGEMCVMIDGTSRFNEGISHRSHNLHPDKIAQGMIDYPVTYMIFDILEIEGISLKDLPWTERRKILEAWFDAKSMPHCKMTEYSEDIMDVWTEVTSRQGEGIILKKTDAVYQDKRSSSWVKVKDIKEVDLRFSKYTSNNAGIRIETDEGIACQVLGHNAPPVQTELEANGGVTVTIRHLGQTKAGKFRQPTYLKIVEVK